jgi:hypothetical protein
MSWPIAVSIRPIWFQVEPLSALREKADSSSWTPVNLEKGHLLLSAGNAVPVPPATAFSELVAQ